MSTVYTETTDAPAPIAAPAAAAPRTLGARVRAWAASALPHPVAAAPAAALPSDPERSARLLTDLTRAVAEAPDDVPLRETIDRLNHPYSD
ncbi:MAG TPA: hypothetical protein VM490_16565 [Armatimonadaceae bacterium]|nr:hypothetical protein [Armatimonadaceae bacterium]